MSYLYAVVAINIAIFALDAWLGAGMYRNSKFWWFQLVIAALTILFDTLASERIWIINDDIASGLKIAGTHIETVLFGFALMYANVVLFEHYARKK